VVFRTTFALKITHVLLAADPKKQHNWQPRLSSAMVEPTDDVVVQRDSNKLVSFDLAFQTKLSEQLN